MNKLLKIIPMIALLFCLCFGLSGCYLFGDRSVTYTLNNDGESYCLTHFGYSVKELIIPETYKGLPVTRIANSAFVHQIITGDKVGVELDKLVLPKSIKVIERGGGKVRKCYYNGTLEDWLNISFGGSFLGGSLYFGGELVEDLRIPDGVTEVPAYSFEGCDSLKTVEIHEGVENIGEYAFSCCRINQVILPQSLKAVGDYAFYYNPIASLEIPVALNNWGECAFARCDIVNLTLPEGLTSVGEGAFEDNILTELTIPSTIEVWGASAFRNCHIEKLNFTDGLQSIGRCAFWVYVGGHDEVIEELTIPQSVKIIEDYAFKGKKIAKLNLPPEVTVGKKAFENCGLTDEDINGNG